MRSRVRKEHVVPEIPPWPALVASTLPTGREVCSPFCEDDVTTAVQKAVASDALVILDSPTGELFGDRAALLGREGGDVLFGCADTAEARAALAADGLNVFKVVGAPDRLFASTYDLPDQGWLVKVTVQKPFGGFANFDACVAEMVADGKGEESARAICGQLQSEAEKGDLVIGPGTPGYLQPEQGTSKPPKRPRREDEFPWDELTKARMDILKLDDTEERLVYGVVLEPDGVDAQNDTISAAEIRQAAHKFMQEFGNVGLQHQTFINGRVRILESFIAPSDMLIGDQPVRKGTWLMAMRVLDDNIWKAVKDGNITGFSIGGSAVRKPVAAS